MNFSLDDWYARWGFKNPQTLINFFDGGTPSNDSFPFTTDIDGGNPYNSISVFTADGGSA